jgi:hypothetical protein
MIDNHLKTGVDASTETSCFISNLMSIVQRNICIIYEQLS